MFVINNIDLLIKLGVVIVDTGEANSIFATFDHNSIDCITFTTSMSVVIIVYVVLAYFAKPADTCRMDTISASFDCN